MQIIKSTFSKSQIGLLLLFPLVYGLIWVLVWNFVRLPYIQSYFYMNLETYVQVIVAAVINGLLVGLTIGGLQMLFLRRLFGLKLRAWIPLAIIAYTIAFFIWIPYNMTYGSANGLANNPYITQLHAISWYLIPAFAGWLVLRRESKWAWLWAGAGITAALVDFMQISTPTLIIPTTHLKWLSAPADIIYVFSCLGGIASIVYLQKNRTASINGETSLSRFGWFGVGWIGIAVLAYPLGIAIPLAIHVLREQIYVFDEIIWLTYWNAYSEHVMIYMIFFTVILAFLQKILLKHFLGFGIPHWFKASALGGLIGVFCIYQVNTPFLDSLELAPWLFCLSAAQAIILYRYTPKAWLWIVAHISIAGLFPIRSDGSIIAMVVLWIVAASVAGGLTAIVFKLIQDSIELGDYRKKNDRA